MDVSIIVIESRFKKSVILDYARDVLNNEVHVLSSGGNYMNYSPSIKNKELVRDYRNFNFSAGLSYILSKSYNNSVEIIIMTDDDDQGDSIALDVINDVSRIVERLKEAGFGFPQDPVFSRAMMSSITRGDFQSGIRARSRILPLTASRMAMPGRVREAIDLIGGRSLSPDIPGEVSLYSFGTVKTPLLSGIAARGAPIGEIRFSVEAGDGGPVFQDVLAVSDEGIAGIGDRLARRLARWRPRKARTAGLFMSARMAPPSLSSAIVTSFRLAGISPEEAMNSLEEGYRSGFSSYHRTESRWVSPETAPLLQEIARYSGFRIAPDLMPVRASGKGSANGTGDEAHISAGNDDPLDGAWYRPAHEAIHLMDPRDITTDLRVCDPGMVPAIVATRSLIEASVDLLPQFPAELPSAADLGFQGDEAAIAGRLLKRIRPLRHIGPLSGLRDRQLRPGFVRYDLSMSLFASMLRQGVGTPSSWIGHIRTISRLVSRYARQALMGNDQPGHDGVNEEPESTLVAPEINNLVLYAKEYSRIMPGGLDLAHRIFRADTFRRSAFAMGALGRGFVNPGDQHGGAAKSDAPRILPVEKANEDAVHFEKQVLAMAFAEISSVCPGAPGRLRGFLGKNGGRILAGNEEANLSRFIDRAITAPDFRSSAIAGPGGKYRIVRIPTTPVPGAEGVTLKRPDPENSGPERPTPGTFSREQASGSAMRESPTNIAGSSQASLYAAAPLAVVQSEKRALTSSEGRRPVTGHDAAGHDVAGHDPDIYVWESLSEPAAPDDDGASGGSYSP